MKDVGLGLLIALLGGAMIYWSHAIVDFLGPIAWAEVKLGGTRKMYILFGFFLVFLGFLFVFGVFDANDVGNATDTGFGETQVTTVEK